MGCCISKCRPHKNSLQHFNHVQDKLVISHAPQIPIPIPHYNPNQISPSPRSPTSSTSSISSFTCTTSNTITSTSSLSSSASSALSSKDRSFSNEFLWSCYKDNPHINRIHSLKEASLSLAPTKARSSKIINPSPAKPSVATIHQYSAPQKLVGSNSMLQKRARSSSPANLTRQKSFRKEPERPNSPYNLSCRTLRSPSPSRRFNNGSALADTSVSKRMINGPKANAAHSHCVSPLIRKENVKAASPNNSSRRLRSSLRHRDQSCSHRIGSKIDETVVKEVLSSNHDMEEDIDNPLISLDCFIFL